jgi:aerobic-type carbon monoxide dehydrogenase small subunit (CoxS/CutS family)
MSAYAMLQKKANPSDDEIIRTMNGNICRCGTYQRILTAIKEGAKALQKGAR